MGIYTIETSEQKTGYKVLALTKSGHLVSCTRLGRPRRYAPRIETRPAKGDGPLTVFGDLRDAQTFIWTQLSGFQDILIPRANFEIWRVRYRPLWAESIWFKSARKYRRRWGMPLWNLPYGTGLAVSITPIECLAFVPRTAATG